MLAWPVNELTDLGGFQTGWNISLPLDWSICNVEFDKMKEWFFVASQCNVPRRRHGHFSGFVRSQNVGGALKELQLLLFHQRKAFVASTSDQNLV